MAIKKMTFYTIICDSCDIPLEDFTGELARITETKEEAQRIAVRKGFCHYNKKWYCPDCAKKLCVSNKLNIDTRDALEIAGARKVPR